MQELKERGAQIFTNPYVIQVDKFAGSLKKLSDTFSKLEDEDSVIHLLTNRPEMRKMTTFLSV